MMRTNARLTNRFKKFMKAEGIVKKQGAADTNKDIVEYFKQLEIEEKINAEVDMARLVSTNNLTRDEAENTPDLIRTKINLLPPDIETVRTIEIHGLDLQADGGTHVASTSEVGPIRVVGHESKGRINKRLRIALMD